MGVLENFLAASEKLYSHLTTIPGENERDDFIDQIDVLLDEREVTIQALASMDKLELQAHPLTDHLHELDRGISERLEKVMDAVKVDIRGLQEMKRKENSYTNPYAATQSIDGMYFDNKK
ncbi:flagellar protein FliT [Psychrobacillus sp.]|uniref:flagellar protein FliT n=1 Tax=Psychrobacillus sp. TaxID=1871623 RepID=UPI0028BD897C|nr:flagellar protein FliT [Psychrobacillus sp.]